MAVTETAGSVGLPTPRPWRLRNARSGEERTFVQTELTIEGEARLLMLVRSTAEELNKEGFPWDALGPLFDPTKDIDWMAAAELLGIIGTRVPDAFAELVSILLSVYPNNEDGSKNAQFDSDIRFFKSAIRFAIVVDMLKVFTEQNDYQRLADPIGAILGQAARSGMATSSSDTSPDAATTGAS